MAAVLSSDMHNTDKVDDFIHECKDLKLTVLPPDVNTSHHAFTVKDDSTICYGLGALKGVGHAAIDMIENEREAHGAYQDLVDFCTRMDLQKVNRRAMDVLIRSGSMDTLDPNQNRARMLHELPASLQAAEQSQRDRESGQSDMFGSVDLGYAGTSSGSDMQLPHTIEHQAIRPWTRLQSLQAERDTLGLYLTGHPVELQMRDLSHFTTCKLGDIEVMMPDQAKGKRRRTPMVLAGLVRAIRRRGSRGGFVSIEDHSGRVEIALFDEAWSLYADLLNKDEIIVVDGRLSTDDFSGGFRMTAQKVMTLSAAKIRFARGIRISLRGPDEDICAALQSTFLPYRKGSGLVWLDYSNARARARLELSEEWGVKACAELVA
ncbi:MAG: OB-fold nucleic acid binding domain-containing protein, partial [Lysobacterales bacterium]